MALRWDDVDLDGRRIRVGPVLGREGTRRRRAEERRGRTHRCRYSRSCAHELLEHRLRTGRSDGLRTSAPTARRRSGDSSVVARAKRVWREAGLTEIGLHECRHTFAALLIAAGVNPKALSTFMGHASISITLDRYGHLLPGKRGRGGRARSTPTWSVSTPGCLACALRSFLSAVAGWRSG